MSRYGFKLGASREGSGLNSAVTDVGWGSSKFILQSSFSVCRDVLSPKIN